jgi:hypothetical protein
MYFRQKYGPLGLVSSASTFDVAAIALARFGFRLGFASAIGGERAADVYDFGKLAFLIPADVALIAFVRFDEGSFACLGGFLCRHAEISCCAADLAAGRRCSPA